MPIGINLCWDSSLGANHSTPRQQIISKAKKKKKERKSLKKDSMMLAMPGLEKSPGSLGG